MLCTLSIMSSMYEFFMIVSDALGKRFLDISAVFLIATVAIVPEGR